MKRLKIMIAHILYPGVVWTILLALLSTAALIFTFNTSLEETLFGYVTYVLSAYTLFVLVSNAPIIVQKIQSFIRLSDLSIHIKSLLYSNEYSSRYMTDIPFRVEISLYGALAMNLLYAVFKLIAGIHYASFWYGADALYYIVLSAARFLLLRHMPKERQDLVKEYRKYRFCGCLLFALNAAFIGVVYQVVNQDMGYQYPGLMIYMVATYAFICLTLAIVNVVKFRKMNSPILSAAKALNLAKALVAIYALQTALFTAFGGDDSQLLQQLMKSLTGSFICVFILIMAVFMVFRANKELKSAALIISKQNSNNSQTVPGYDKVNPEEER